MHRAERRWLRSIDTTPCIATHTEESSFTLEHVRICVTAPKSHDQTKNNLLSTRRIGNRQGLPLASASYANNDR